MLAVCSPEEQALRIAFSCDTADRHDCLSSRHQAADQGFVGRVLETGHAAVETLNPNEVLSLGLAASGAPLRYAAGAAVRPPGRPPGALCIGFATLPGHDARTLTLWMVERYAGLAALRTRDEGVLEGLLAAARLDSLTGCLHHTAIRAEPHREVERSARRDRRLSCCFIDLDRLKHIDYSYAHPHGSQMLAEAAAPLREGIRIGDTLGRYGGDEFVAIPSDTDQGAALVLAERLRSTISTTTLNGAHEPLGASVGVAQSRPGCTAEDLLAAADDALRTSKRAGGGLVVGASDVAAGAGRGVACRTKPAPNHRRHAPRAMIAEPDHREPEPRRAQRPMMTRHGARVAARLATCSTNRNHRGHDR